MKTYNAVSTLCKLFHKCVLYQFNFSKIKCILIIMAKLKDNYQGQIFFLTKVRYQE